MSERSVDPSGSRDVWRRRAAGRSILLRRKGGPQGPTPPFANPPFAPPQPPGRVRLTFFGANFDRPQRHPGLTPPPPTSPYFLSACFQWLGMLGSVCRCGTAEIIPKKFNKYYMNPTV